MTIRGGGRPRDRGPQAHPIDRGPEVVDGYGSAPTPVRRQNGRGMNGRPSNGRTGNGRGGGSGGHHGVLRFGLFALVLGGAVLLLSVTLLRPLTSAALAAWAVDSPSLWGLPFVGDAVADALADELATPASDDPTELVWTVRSGDTVESVGQRLADEGLVSSEPAFAYAAFEQRLADRLAAGDFRLQRDMTPSEVVTALIEARIVITSVDVTFREGLRLEQLTAKLQTVASRVDPAAFYALVTDPPADLVDAYPWLDLPDGATLEGYLYPATYTLRTDDLAPTDAEDLVRSMLDTFAERVGQERLDAISAGDTPLRTVLTLASIVEEEAVLADERPIIAGVYRNRLDREMLLGADPTVIYGADGAALDDTPFDAWQEYFFGEVPSGPLAEVDLPEPWDAYNTYRYRGLPPGPISSPTTASIDAALAPDTTDGFLYFVAIPNGDGKHDFSKTFDEHTRKLHEYGYL